MNGRAAAPPANRLHHRRFHFEIPALVKEPPQRLEHLGALHKDFAAVEVGEQVYVALAIAQLHVGQAVIFFRQREHGLGQKRERLHVHRQLAGAGTKQIAGDSDVVAQIEQLVEREASVADCVEPDVDLQPRALLLQRGESGLALQTDGHDAPGHGYRYALGLKLLAGRLVPLRAHLGQRDRLFVLPGREPVGIGHLPQLFDLFEFLFAKLEEILFKLRVEHVIFLCHRWLT